ncbi:PREDICTED: uncharacterized protein LOC106292653 isoform X1 [Brassica oleracea var. oleracea]|uniref:Uncharacterized protein n=1 Tax=Brassica oleracea var. oleracea TaxID=109376 RepID=A0A0D3A2E5_BRAOL|nr:PREDICTED: uncharacterized protein LOC106292653 isoform X1 [Brassica oleracea var. oleracea]
MNQMRATLMKKMRRTAMNQVPLANFRGRGFSSGSTGSSKSDTADPVTWFKVFKGVASRFLFNRLVSRCENNPVTARRLCSFVNKTEGWKASLNNYSSGSGGSKMVEFLSQDKSMVRSACQVFCNTYTGTFVATALALGWLGFNQSVRVFDKKEAEESVERVDARLSGLSRKVDVLDHEWHMAKLYAVQQMRNAKGGKQV